MSDFIKHPFTDPKYKRVLKASNRSVAYKSTCAARLDQSGNRKGKEIHLYKLQQVRKCTY